MLGGLAIANVVGVPAGTSFGQQYGWRSAYLLVTVIFAVALVAIVVAVPFRPGDPRATLRNELSAFTRLQVWLTLILGSVGFGGIFAVYTYVAPVVTDVAGLPAAFVPWALVVFGIGMTTGTFVSGWLADRSVTSALLISLGAVGVSVLGFALFAGSAAGIIVFLLLIGACAGACSPAIQTRLMDVSHNAQSIAAALNHSALNIGNSLGAFLGGLAIAGGFGYLSPALVGVGLAAAGFAVLLVSLGIDRRRRLAR